MEWNEDKRNGELAMLIAKISLKFGENNRVLVFHE
jgi:hypothetical protein